MKKKHDRKGKQSLEEAIATLSLAADRSKAPQSAEKKDNCIADEDLAALLDNKCSPEEVKAIRAHLSECERCYQQCLFLSTLKLGAEKTSRPVSRFRRSKIYGYIGSAMALAAGVAVYLNVAQQGPLIFTQEEVQPSTPAGESYKKEQTVGETWSVKENTKYRSQASDQVSRSLDETAKIITLPPVESTKRLEISTDSKKPMTAQSAPSPQTRSLGNEKLNEQQPPAILKDFSRLSSPKKAVRDIVTSSSVDQERRDSGDEQLTVWYRRLTDFCATSEDGGPSIAELLEKGRWILENKEGTLSAIEVRRIISINRVLLQMERDRDGKWCKEIEAILAEAIKSR